MQEGAAQIGRGVGPSSVATGVAVLDHLVGLLASTGGFEIRLEVAPDEPEAEVGTESRSFWGEPFESWRDGNLVGTPEQVAEKLQAYIDLGCTGF
jgi:alkanesulfonate monooxygenase SsuD/methylene tetrahydromethanopterin reductase-like flavin-dependent oxidoreductase (luciferase family)